MSIYEELRRVQRELKAPKGKVSKFGGFNYRSAEDILLAVKPLLGDLVLLLNDEIIFSGILEDELVGSGDKMVKLQTQRTYIKATATLTDGKDSIVTSAYAREAAVKKGQDPAMGSGSCSSYARKYCLNGLFAIDESEMDIDNDYQVAAHNKGANIEVEVGNDMTLEGLAGVVSEPPKKKRIDKALMQEVVIGLVAMCGANDDAGISEIFDDLSQEEEDHVWRFFNGKQQNQIRAASQKKGK